MTLTLALQLCQVFGITSLLAFGGGNAVIPQFQMLTVEHYHWLTSRQFTDAFAIAQAAPGPSTLIVSLLGYRAGGVWGALIFYITALALVMALKFRTGTWKKRV